MRGLSIGRRLGTLRAIRPCTMLPTSTLPVSPFLGSSGMGLAIGVLAVGALVAILVGYTVHRREQRKATRVDLAPDDGASETGRRLSA
jgi:hypothetical protein